MSKRVVRRGGDGRSLLRLGLCCMALLGGAGGAIASATPLPTIVPEEDRISDSEALLALARLLAESPATVVQAEEHYRQLLQLYPAGAVVRLEYVRFLVRLGRSAAAAREMEAARRLVLPENHLPVSPAQREAIVGLADLEAELGHLRQCRDLYEQALRLAGSEQEELALRYANRMNQWGDFLRAEALLRKRLQMEPENHDLWMALAEILANTQRYAEAEGIYGERLLLAPARIEVLFTLAKLKHAEGDYPAALHRVKEFLAKEPEHLEGRLLLGELLLRQPSFQEAVDLFREMAVSSAAEFRVYIGLGRALQRAGRQEEARQAFNRGMELAPASSEARYYAAGAAARIQPGFLAGLLSDQDRSAMGLVAWGNLYGEHGETDAAIACYEAALGLDRACFPARLALAENLASRHSYDRALAELTLLEQEFPDNPKLLLTHARVLSWAREYDAALLLYGRLLSLEPANPVVRVERARTAAWGKRMEQAQALYAELWAKPVDVELREALARKGQTSLVVEFSEPGKETAPGNGVFRLYENFAQELATRESGMPHDQWLELALLRERLFGRYRIQKSAFLESQAKRLAWQKNNLQAREVYGELLAFQGGNQEALLDAAQVACVLGMCDEEGDAYQRLLVISPLHTLAETAMNRQQTRSNPAVGLDYGYWKESGRGELSRMERQRQEAVVELPIACRFRVQASLGQEEERTGLGSGPYRSERLGIRLFGPITPALRGVLGWSEKEYTRDGLPDLGAGQAELWYNLHDRMEVGLGVNRIDEIYNDFGLWQGVQADHWWGAINSDLGRRLRLETMAERLEYTDGNSGEQQSVALGYQLTDHPRMLRLIAEATHRDTRDANIFRTVGGETRDIIHPYWTPQDYWSHGLTLEWYHDLAKLFLCGGEQHYYDVRLSLGNDSDQNPSARLELKWHYDLTAHWQGELKGLVHFSEEWDATGLWATVRYRF